MREHLDIADVEARTKIRAKYLRALENEEFGMLPGPTFVKTFLRSYADYLGLDSRLLVEEYKQRFERPSTMELTPFARGPGPRREHRRRRALLGPGLAVVFALLFVILNIMLTQLIIEPITQLSDAAEHISKGRGVPELVTTGRDEVAQLGQAFGTGLTRKLRWHSG